MFYPVESLRRGGRFYLCWVADSWPLQFATITHRQLWSQDIRKICDDLLEVMKTESGRPKNRFSLRLSSQLLRGVVRLYQRKVTVFVGDLCMINALVMKSTNKNLNRFHEPSHHAVRRPELPKLVFEEQPEEENVEERIQNSDNIVAHIQDITLKEPTLPENRLHLDDGFGELNPNQPLQLLDRTMEMMLVQETSAVQHSGLNLPDVSADKSRNRSILTHESAQMEMISEHDISAFKKSVGADVIPGADFEKEIPEIPEILPELPAPVQMDNQTKRQNPEQIAQAKYYSNEIAKEKSSEEMVLEDLEDEQPQIKRRKLKNKLIIDENIKLSSNYIRSRIDNINVEQRCEESIQDIIRIYAKPEILLNRAAHCGTKLHTNLGYKLSYMFARNLGTRVKLNADKEMEEVIASRSRRSRMRSYLEKIVEVNEPAADNSAGPPQDPQNVSKSLDIADTNLINIPENIEITNIVIDHESVDISILPTQRVMTSSQAEMRAGENEPSPKRKRSGFTSFRLSQEMALVTTNLEANKENIPENHAVDRITVMLHEAGLADIQERQTNTQERRTDILTQIQRRNGSDSETPLGSLDRTKVSLGDSDKTTDSTKFIREEWGTHGTMHKIYKNIKRGVSPLYLDYLLANGPILPGYKRLIAARCFTSILKLKHHGFVKILKNPDTNEIIDISLGNKIIT